MITKQLLQKTLKSIVLHGPLASQRLPAYQMLEILIETLPDEPKCPHCNDTGVIGEKRCHCILGQQPDGNIGYCKECEQPSWEKKFDELYSKSIYPTWGGTWPASDEINKKIKDFIRAELKAMGEEIVSSYKMQFSETRLHYLVENVVNNALTKRGVK